MTRRWRRIWFGFFAVGLVFLVLMAGLMIYEWLTLIRIEGMITRVGGR